MATSKRNAPSRTVDTRLFVTVIGVSVLAAVGSVFVAIGLSDLLSYANGYRPSHWIVVSYAQAFVVTAAGWFFFAAAAVGTARAALAVR